MPPFLSLGSQVQLHPALNTKLYLIFIIAYTKRLFKSFILNQKGKVTWFRKTQSKILYFKGFLHSKEHSFYLANFQNYKKLGQRQQRHPYKNKIFFDTIYIIYKSLQKVHISFRDNIYLNYLHLT